MAQPDPRDIQSGNRTTYITETSFIEDSFVSDDEDPIVEDFAVVSDNVKYLNKFVTDYQYNRENLSATECSDRAEDIYEVKESTIKRIISARWRLNEYLSAEEQDVHEKFGYLQQFAKDLVGFLKILFLLSSETPKADETSSPEDEVKSKYSTLISNPGADLPGGDTCARNIPTSSGTHEEDDIAILQGIRTEVEQYSQQWAQMNPLYDEQKQVFSSLDSDDGLTRLHPISFRSLSTRRNILWVMLGVIAGAVIFFAVIILLLIIVFGSSR